VQGSRCGLRRLTTNLGLIGLLGATSLVAAHASAAPAPTLFRLTITGTAHQEWSHTASPVKNGDCSRTVKSEGIRTATFRTSRPIVVRLSGGRVLPIDLRGISGTVTLGGANTTDETCPGGTGTAQIADCVQSRRSFGAARVRLSSPRRGVVALGSIRTVGLVESDCPIEPVDVRRRPLGPVPGPLRLPKAALMERNVSRITLSASRSRRKTYAAPEAGRLDERAEWALTFVRVQS
jgi:hypothetical protein